MMYSIVQSLYIYTYVCIHVIHRHMTCVYLCIYIYTYICIYLCIYIYVDMNIDIDIIRHRHPRPLYIHHIHTNIRKLPLTGEIHQPLDLGRQSRPQTQLGPRPVGLLSMDSSKTFFGPGLALITMGSLPNSGQTLHISWV